jgi:hypothetical protein
MFGSGSSGGLEMALRSMGLGTVLDAAKQLAESGAVQKIVQFADGLEETNARLARIEAALNIETPARGTLLIEGTAELRSAADEPAAGADYRHVAGG